MKQIKTVLAKFDAVGSFDKVVNEFLATGWTITNREVMQAVVGENGVADRALVAFLEKDFNV